MRFSANVSLLFKEAPLLERFGLARSAGFDTVELWWPNDIDTTAVAAAIRDADVDVALLNLPSDSAGAGELGLASDPARQVAFRASVPAALALAQTIGCRQLNALVGLRLPHLRLEDQLEVARENVRFAADQAAKQEADVLIEALNTVDNGPYLLSTTRAAHDFVTSVERANVQIQYDVYHMQRMEGDLVATLECHIADIGHIQIADVPGRGFPGTGEVNFEYLLGRIEELGYAGFVGLEYEPSQDGTTACLEWLPRSHRAARPQGRTSPPHPR